MSTAALADRVAPVSPLAFGEAAITVAANVAAIDGALRATVVPVGNLIRLVREAESRKASVS
jgi:hypothetical protein